MEDSLYSRRSRRKFVSLPGRFKDKADRKEKEKAGCNQKYKPRALGDKKKWSSSSSSDADPAKQAMLRDLSSAKLTSIPLPCISTNAYPST